MIVPGGFDYDVYNIWLTMLPPRTWLYLHCPSDVSDWMIFGLYTTISNQNTGCYRACAPKSISFCRGTREKGEVVSIYSEKRWVFKGNEQSVNLIDVPLNACRVVVVFGDYQTWWNKRWPKPWWPGDSSNCCWCWLSGPIHHRRKRWTTCQIVSFSSLLLRSWGALFMWISAIHAIQRKLNCFPWYSY